MQHVVNSDLTADLNRLAPFLAKVQLNALIELLQGEESSFFADAVSALSETVRRMPKTYEQEPLGDQATVHLHYFLNGCDWYIIEKDKLGNGTKQAFGLAQLGLGYAELGYININEITQVGAELDLHWRPVTLAQVRQSLTS